MSEDTSALSANDVALVAGAPRWTARTWLAVTSLAATTFALVSAEFLPAGLLTPMAADLGITEGTAGQVVTATAVVGAVAALFTNVLIGRIDRKLVLAALAALGVAANLLATFADAFWILLLARAALGVAIAGFWALAASVVARLVGVDSLGRGMSIIFVGVSLATIAAPSAGALISDMFGWRAAMLAAAAASFLALLLQLACLPRLPASHGNSLGSVLGLIGRGKVALGMLAIMLLAGGHFAGFVYVRPFLEQVPVLSAPMVAAALLGYGIASVLGNVVGGRLADTNVRFALLATAALLGTAALALAILGTGTVIAITLVALWGLAFGATPIVLQTNLSRAALDDLEGAGSLMVVCFQVAIAAGAMLGGFVVDTLGVGYAPILTAVPALLGVLLAALLPKD